MRDKTEVKCRGREGREDTGDHGLCRRLLRVTKTSYELTWGVKVIMKQKNNNKITITAVGLPH